jgi:hypothetical protein
VMVPSAEAHAGPVERNWPLEVAEGGPATVWMLAGIGRWGEWVWRAGQGWA